MTVEEFDDRRRCGAILILEGRYGQGWELFVSEVQLANLVLHEVREVKERKKEKEEICGGVGAVVSTRGGLF